MRPGEAAAGDQFPPTNAPLSVPKIRRNFVLDKRPFISYNASVFLWRAAVGQVVVLRETPYGNDSAQASFRRVKPGPNDPCRKT